MGYGYKLFVSMVLILIGSQSVCALELSESTINAGLVLGFPRTIKGVELTAPAAHFEEGRAEFCATAQPKWIGRSVDFCAKFDPVWDASSAQLNASNMELTKLSAQGISPKTSDLLKVGLNKEVLPYLNGIKIYKSENWIGKQLKTVKVKPGALVLNVF